MNSDLNLHRSVDVSPVSPRRIILGLISIFTVFCFLLTGANTAIAAPNQVKIDSVNFVNEDGVVVNGFENGSKQLLSVDMSIPGNATTPVAGTIYLDERLKGNDDRIVIKSPEGEDIGLCLVYTDRVECSLDDWYVEAHPQNMSGSFEFWVWIEAGNSGDEDIDFTVGDKTTNTVTVDPRPELPQCETDCEYEGTDGFKQGTFKPHEGTVEWWVRVPAGPDGMPIGHTVIVEDHLDENIYEVVGEPKVYYFDRAIQNAEGKEQMIYSNALPRDEYEVLDNNKIVTFTTAPGLGADASLPPGERGLTGRVYDVIWTVKLLDGGSSANYKNSVTITVIGPDGEDVYEKEGSVQGQGGSGQAVGTNQGRLSIEKVIDGSAAGREDLPTAYAVNYQVCDTMFAGYDPANIEGPGCDSATAELRPGTKTWLPAYPAGTRIVGTEVLPTEPENVSWDGNFQLVDASGNPLPGSTSSDTFDVTFSQENGNLGQLTYYRVTNTATDTTPKLAPFQARKTIQNDDGVDLSGISSYTLQYSYTAGDGFPAGSGELQIPANGNLVISQDLPIGAELEFSEVLPPVENATWATPQITPSTLTITGDPAQAEITVANEIDASLGRFTAQKVISTDDGIDPNTLPDVQLDYWYTHNEIRTDGSLTLKPGGPAQISPEIPIGVEVHFSEATPPAVPGITWGDASISPNPLTIDGDPSQDVLVTVTNPVELNDGFFTARKVVNDVDGTGVAITTEFEINYAWTLADLSGSGTIRVGNGSSGVSEAIPIGAQVTITEAAPAEIPEHAWGTPIITPSTFVMEEDVDVVVSVENPLTATHGTFTATKMIDRVDGVGPADADLPSFELAYTWTFGGESGADTMLIAPGVTARSGPIPFGASIEVTEATPADVPGYEWGTPTVTPKTFDLVKGDEEVLVTVTNPISIGAGEFSARKLIENPDELNISGVDGFTLLYQWTAVGNIPGGQDTLRLKPNGDVETSVQIPYGSNVTVVEVPPLDPEGGQWGDPSFGAEGTTRAEFVMTPGVDEQVQLEVTNTVVRDLGRFWAHKVFKNPDNVSLETGDDQPDQPTFTLQYDYVFPWIDASAPPAERGGSATLELPANGQTMQSISLPHGTEVTVAELDVPEVVGATWADPELSITEFTIDTDAETTVDVAVTNELTRDLGGFSARKVVVNNDNVDLTGLRGYELAYTYTFPWVADDAPADKRGGEGSLMMPATGEVVVSDRYPHGTEISVTEVEPVGVGGVLWDQMLSVTDFVVDTTVDPVIEVLATNTVTRDLTHFNAVKLIENPDDVDLSGITSYELTYAYTFPWVADDAPAEERGGEGSLMLAASGEVSVNSIDLPHGTVVKVTEVLPVAPAGTTWDQPVYSKEEFTLNADRASVYTVEVTNKITDDSNVGGGVEGNSDANSHGNGDGNKGGGLPSTGGESSWLLALAALLIGSAGVFLMRRRQRS